MWTPIQWTEFATPLSVIGWEIRVRFRLSLRCNLRLVLKLSIDKGRAPVVFFTTWDNTTTQHSTQNSYSRFERIIFWSHSSLSEYRNVHKWCSLRAQALSTRPFDTDTQLGQAQRTKESDHFIHPRTAQWCSTARVALNNALTFWWTEYSGRGTPLCGSETYELHLLLLQYTRINGHAVERTHGWLRTRQVLYSLVQHWIFARPLLRRPKRRKRHIVATQTASPPKFCCGLDLECFCSCHACGRVFQRFKISETLLSLSFWGVAW